MSIRTAYLYKLLHEFQALLYYVNGSHLDILMQLIAYSVSATLQQHVIILLYTKIATASVKICTGRA